MVTDWVSPGEKLASRHPDATVVRVDETDIPGEFDMLLSDGTLLEQLTVGMVFSIIREIGFRGEKT